MMSHELYLTLVYRPNVSRISRALQATERTRAAIAQAQADALRQVEEKSALVERILRGFAPRLLGTRLERRPTLLRTRRVPGLPGQRPLAPGAADRRPALPDPADHAAVLRHRQAGTAPRRRAPLRRAGRHPRVRRRGRARHPERPALRAQRVHRDAELLDPAAPRGHARAGAAARPADRQRRRGRQPGRRHGPGAERAGRRPVLHGRVPLQPGGLRRRRGRRRPARGAGHRRRGRVVAACRWRRWTWWPMRPGSRRCRATGSGGRARPSCRRAPSRRWPAATTSRAASATATPGARRWRCCARPSGQPFYLNLHSSPAGAESADEKLPGNTLIIGSTGVGKTTLEMFLLVLTRKWRPAPRIVLFDLDRGSRDRHPRARRPLLRAAGRPAHRLQPAAARADAGPDPVLGAADPHLHRQRGAAADAGRRARHRRRGEGGGHDAGGACAASRRPPEPAEDRPEQPVRAPRAAGARAARSGWVFDEADDRLGDLQASSVIAFDTTDFLDLPEVRTPVMLYLLHVMEEPGHRRAADLRDLGVLEGAGPPRLQRLRQAEAEDHPQAQRPGHLRHPEPVRRAAPPDRPHDGRAERDQDLPGQPGGGARGIRRRLRPQPRRVRHRAQPGRPGRPALPGQAGPRQRDLRAGPVRAGRLAHRAVRHHRQRRAAGRHPRTPW